MDFEPRIGLAYRIGSKTVVRAGYGRSYSIGFYGANFGAITNDWPNATRQQLVQNNIYQPVITLAQGPPVFVSGFEILAAAGNPGQYPTPNSTGFGEDRRNPDNYVDQWNFAIQHEFPKNFTLRRRMSAMLCDTFSIAPITTPRSPGREISMRAGRMLRMAILYPPTINRTRAVPAINRSSYKAKSAIPRSFS